MRKRGNRQGHFRRMRGVEFGIAEVRGKRASIFRALISGLVTPLSRGERLALIKEQGICLRRGSSWTSGLLSQAPRRAPVNAADRFLQSVRRDNEGKMADAGATMGREEIAAFLGETSCAVMGLGRLSDEVKARHVRHGGEGPAK